MAWSGTGTFSRIVTTVSPATNGTTIDVADQNTYTTDVTNGINACLAKNGENTPSSDLPMGGQKHTGVADGVAANDYAALGQLQDGFGAYAADTGAANAYVITLSPALTAYAAGQTFRFKASASNTGASTIDINGLGTKDIKTSSVAVLPSDSIITNGVHTIVYDGTQFQLQDAPSVEQVQNAAFAYDGTVGGTANDITLSLDPPLTAYAAGQVFRFLADDTNTGTVTINVDGLGVKVVRTNSITALRAGDISLSGVYTVVYDGTRFLLQNPERESEQVFSNNSNGNPNVSDTGFNLTDLTINNYETIGPTAAGSTNTWTALDSVPTGVDWIEVAVNCSVTGTATIVSAEALARASGGSSSSSATQFIARTSLGDGTSNAKTSATTSRGIKIPVDSAVEFEGKYTSTAGTPSILLYLTGYGWN